MVSAGTSLQSRIQTVRGSKRPLNFPCDNLRAPQLPKTDVAHSSYARAATFSPGYMGVIAPALNYFDDISDTQQIYIRQTVNKAAIHNHMENGEAPYFKYMTYSESDKKLHVNAMDKETLDWCRSSIFHLITPDGDKFKLWTDSDYDKLHKLKITIYNHRPE